MKAYSLKRAFKRQAVLWRDRGIVTGVIRVPGTTDRYFLAHDLDR